MTPCFYVLHHSMWHFLATLTDSTTEVYHPIQSTGVTSFPQVALDHPSNALLFWSQWRHTQEHSRCTYKLARTFPLSTHGAQLRPELQTSASSHGANGAQGSEHEHVSPNRIIPVPMKTWMHACTGLYEQYETQLGWDVVRMGCFCAKGSPRRFLLLHSGFCKSIWVSSRDYVVNYDNLNHATLRRNQRFPA
jgi:hypothetical protein